MSTEVLPRFCVWVAPRMGCVDRNCLGISDVDLGARRTPHGVRGSKFLWHDLEAERHESRTPHGVRGSKSTMRSDVCWTGESHPAWGAWIEMDDERLVLYRLLVAPRMGCVDRNFKRDSTKANNLVAPRMGCVDRNIKGGKINESLCSRTPHGVRGSK